MDLHSKGLARWKGGKLTGYREFAGRRVDKILEDHSGTVWAIELGVPAGQLCAIQENGVRCYGDGRPPRQQRDVAVRISGRSVGRDKRRLWRWKPDPPQLYPVPGPKREINDLIEGDNGALWIAMHDGIRQWAGGKIEPAPLPSGSQIDAHSLLRDRDGACGWEP